MKARVFKAQYRARPTPEQIAAGINKGEIRKSEKWYIEFRDHKSIVRRMPAFTDYELSEKLGEKLVELVLSFTNNGGEIDQSLKKWVKEQSPETRRRIAAIGLIKSRLARSAKTPLVHAVEYRDEMKAKEATAKHADQQYMRITAIIKGIQATTFYDIERSAVIRFLKNLRQGTATKPGISIATSNHYLSALRSFVAWAVEQGLTTENEIAGIDKLNSGTDKRHGRRALSADEVQRLLTATEAGPTRWGMSGWERATIYGFAIESGLRSDEIRTITRAAFILDAEPPHVVVAAKNTKNRKQARIPLRPAMVDRLRPRLNQLEPMDLVFRMTGSAMSKPMRRDLEAAKIEYRREGPDGPEYADFHSLRHTMISNLAKAGVHPKQAQDLARHSSVDLTMNFYTHTLLSERAEGIEMSPSVWPTISEQSELKATGTDDRCLASCLAESVAPNRPSSGTERKSNDKKRATISIEAHRQNTNKTRPNQHIPKLSNSVESVGLEPTTTGLKVRCQNTGILEENASIAPRLSDCLALIDRLLNEPTLSDECRGIIEQHTGNGRRWNPWVDRCDKIPTS